jgi:SAM-dependent methyltransferase
MTRPVNSNQSVYEREDVVQEYALESRLQPPEATFLAVNGDWLKRARMLDIGIGAGRTTAHFAPVVDAYVGVDYSAKMIEVCRRRFPALARADALHVADAASLKQFSDDSFDLVLFSFNGIDYASEADRLLILAEMRRVTRDGGHMLLSTHNLCSDLEAGFVWQPGSSRRDIVLQPLRRMRFRWVNGDWRQKRRETDHMLLKDGTHGFHLRTYYIKPTAQIRQLVDHGYSEIQVITNDGRIIAQADVVNDPPDPWVHFWSRVRK